jgi:FkbM family methyltransferase
MATNTRGRSEAVEAHHRLTGRARSMAHYLRWSSVDNGRWIRAEISFPALPLERNTSTDAPSTASPSAVKVAGSFFVDGRAGVIMRYVRDSVGEQWVGRTIREALARAHCASNGAARPPFRRPLVVDIGANAGFYTMLSLNLGAHVTAIDAQPTCWSFINGALRKNGYHSEERAQLIRRGISPSLSPIRLLPSRGGAGHECDGHFGQRNSNQFALLSSTVDSAARPGAEQDAAVDAVPLASIRDGLLGATLADESSIIELIKCDVEGMELGILNSSLLPLLAARRIKHVIVEFTPGWWNESLGTGSRRIAANLVARVVESGYSMRSRLLNRRRRVLRSPRDAAGYVRGMMFNGEDLHFQRLGDEFGGPCDVVQPR